MVNSSNSATPQPGNIDLKCGQLEDTAHEEFLTTGGCIKAFCNNFNGVFGRKCVRVGRPHSLDDNLAGLFGLMPTGSVLITFSKLDFLVSWAAHLGASLSQILFVGRFLQVAKYPTCGKLLAYLKLNAQVSTKRRKFGWGQ